MRDDKAFRDQVKKALIAAKGRMTQAQIAEACGLTHAEIRGFASTGTLLAAKLDRLVEWLRDHHYLEAEETTRDFPARASSPSSDLLGFVADHLRASLRIIEDPAWGEAENAAGTLGDYPDHSAYRKAVDYACDTACGAAGLTKAESWKITPYQICHLRLGEIDFALGKEHARATRGHSAATMTANYTKDADAEKNRRLAIEAACVGCGD